jgi:ABC-type polysaccharide/polyol phosphate export permease
MTTATQELWQYRGLIGNFAQRELKGRYRGSALGSLWSLLNPLATLGVYTLVFGFFLKFQPPVAGNGRLDNFAVYLFTGLVVWNLFFTVVTGSMAALVGAGPLLKKIYFPAYAPVAGNAISVLVQSATEVGLLLVIYALLRNMSWTVLLVPVLLALLTAFSLGVGLVFSILNARFRDVNYLVQVALQLLFYASPIIYPIKYVTDEYDKHPWLRIYEWNPITVFVEAFRDVLYDLQVPSLSRFLYLVVVSAAVLVGGWAYFRAGSRDVSEEL